jgi:hypothetical protein
MVPIKFHSIPSSSSKEIAQKQNLDGQMDKIKEGGRGRPSQNNILLQIPSVRDNKAQLPEKKS